MEDFSLVIARLFVIWLAAVGGMAFLLIYWNDFFADDTRKEIDYSPEPEDSYYK